MPNPVYAVYYGAAVMAGAEPVLLPATAETGFLPDLDALTPALLARTALLYLCSPGQPAGCRGRPRLSASRRAARPRAWFPAGGRRVLRRALGRRRRRPAALAAALAEGGELRAASSCSTRLSKRSSAAGLRSGFVAGDPGVLARLLRLRAYALAGAAVAAAGRGHGALAATRRMSRPTARSTGPSSTWRSAGSATGSASTARPAASSCGSTSATARPRPRACGARRGAGAARRLSRPIGDAAARMPARPTSGVALVDEIGTVDRALERLADVLGDGEAQDRPMTLRAEETGMAASTADAFGGAPLRARLTEQPAPARRPGGSLALASGLAVALVGFDWRDPSLNQATAHVVHNPAGPAGAYAADLLYQLFGFAAWLPVMVGLSWGLRLMLGRPLAWPWLPVLSLPLALLRLAALPRDAAAAADREPGRCGSAWAVPSATCNGAGSSRGSGSAPSPAAAWCWPCCSASPRSGSAGPRASGPPAASLPARSGSGGAGRRRRCRRPCGRAGWCAEGWLGLARRRLRRADAIGRARRGRPADEAAAAGPPQAAACDARRARTSRRSPRADAARAAAAARRTRADAGAAAAAPAAPPTAEPAPAAQPRRQPMAPSSRRCAEPADAGFELPDLDLLAPVEGR